MSNTALAARDAEFKKRDAQVSELRAARSEIIEKDDMWVLSNEKIRQVSAWSALEWRI